MTDLGAPQNIAIPTNFQSCAKNACIYAASLFKPFGSSFTLINSFESSGDNFHEFRDKAQDSSDKVSKEADLMKSLVGDHLVKNLSVYGKPSRLPETLLHDHEFDCIAMGTSGSKDTSKNTITSELLNRVDLSFLVVPEQAAFRNPKKILLVSDLKNFDDIFQTNKFDWLIKGYGSALELGVVSHYDEDLNNEQRQNLDQLKTSLSLTDEAIHHIHEDDVILGISKIVNSYQADLVIALGRHKTFIDRLTKRSITQELAETLNRPLFITSSQSKL